MDKLIDRNPNVGILFSTYACVPYVHLFLEMRENFFPTIPAIVLDDCGPDFISLSRICSLYNVELISTPMRLKRDRGDINAFLSSLLWSSSIGLDFVVKISRRFIPLYDWTQDFSNLVLSTQYQTYCNECPSSTIGFRSECAAMHVNSWFNHRIIDRLRFAIHNDIGLVEAYVHNLAREIHYHTNCEFNKDYELTNPLPYRISAYGKWDMIGNNRWKKTSNVLWHHHSKIEEYLEISEKYSLPYKLNDFTNVIED